MTKPKATNGSETSGATEKLPATIAGRYQIKALLGRGGFGQVFEAYDELSDRDVAVKIIRHHGASGDTTEPSSHATEGRSRASIGPFGRTATRRTITRTFGTTPNSASSEAVSQFRDEFRILTQLHHPNLAAVYDFGRCPDLRAEYFTQELVRGPVLSEFLKGASRETIVAIFVQLAQALDYIHTLGLVHDDIKPSNVLVATDDPDRGPQAKLIDFGLGQVVRGRPEKIETDDGEAIVVLGTPGFAAPEKVRGVPADVRSDIYSLGATLYTAIVGRRPFAGKTFKDVRKSQEDWRPELAGAIVPVAGPIVAELIGRMLEPDPDKRPPSARALVLELLRREAPHLRDQGPSVADRKEFARVLVEHLPFIDRGGVLEALLRRATDVLLGDRDASASRSGTRPRLIRTVIVEAPEGMGKHRLMAELRREVQLGDGLFVEANFWQGEATGLGPFAAVVQQLASALGASNPVTRRFSDLVSLARRTASASAEAAQRVQEFILAAAEVRPFVLHLSDLSHAPEHARDAFDKLCRAVEHNEARILVCATSEPHPKITQVFNNLQRDQVADTIRLRPFQGKEMKEVLRAVFGEIPVLEELTTLLEKLTGGHPLSFRETLRTLIEENLLVREQDTWTLRNIAAATDILHTSLAQRAEQRLDGIGALAWEVASALYLIEFPVEEDVLEELIGLRKARFRRTLERLNAEGLVQLSAVTGSGLVQLAHDSVRQAVARRYGDALDERRLDLAEALEPYTEQDPQFVRLRARLLDEASEGLESCDELERAANRLFEMEQPQLAAQVLDRLIARLRRHGGVANLDRLLRAKLLLLEQAAGALEDPRKELAHYQGGTLLAEILGDASAEAKFWLGLADRFITDSGEDLVLALERLAKATDAACRAKDRVLELQIANRRAEVLLGVGDVEKASAASERALAILDEPEVSDVVKSHVIGVRMRCLALAGRTKEGIELHERGREIARRVPVVQRQTYLSGVAYLAAFGGDPTIAVDELRDAVEELRAANLSRLLLTPLHNLGDILTRTGDLAGAENAFCEALRLAQLYGYDYHVHLNKGFLGYVRARRGDPETGAEMLEEAKRGLAEQSGDHVSLQQLRLLAAEVAHMRGRSAQAKRDLEELLAEFHASRELSLAQWAHEALARIEQDVGTSLFVIPEDDGETVADPDEETVRTRPLG